MKHNLALYKYFQVVVEQKFEEASANHNINVNDVEKNIKSNTN
jgi:hypothetical protein